MIIWASHCNIISDTQVLVTVDETATLSLVFVYIRPKDTVPLVTREAYIIPKIEYTVRVQPLNILIAPEVGKESLESVSWGELRL
jgi:hypothetical protein